MRLFFLGESVSMPPSLNETLSDIGQPSLSNERPSTIRKAVKGARKMAEFVAYLMIIAALILIVVARALAQRDRRSHSSGMRLL